MAIDFLNGETKVANIEDPIKIMEDGSIENADFEILPTSISKFVERALIGQYDFNPPFQRKECWSPELQGNLIIAILKNKPIPPVYLASKQTNIAEKNVVDAKQRGIAILKFWEGLLKIPILYKEEIIFASYKDIKMRVENGDKLLSNIKQKFEDYMLNLVVYNKLDLKQQCGLFGEINTYVPMTNEEMVFGQYYFAKEFFNVIMTKISDLLRHVRGTEVNENKNEKCAIFIARACLTCFGENLCDQWAIRELGLENPKRTPRKKVKKIGRGKLQKLQAKESVKPLNRMIKNLDKELMEIIEKNQITDSLNGEHLELLQCNKQIELFVKACREMAAILEYNNTTRKKMNRTDVHDILCFLIREISAGRLTNAILKDNKSVFMNFFIKIEEEKERRKMTGQSVAKTSITPRVNLIDDLYEDVPLDKNVKNVNYSNRQETLARLKSGNICEIDGSALSDKNGRIDHVDNKSMNSQTEFVLVSNYGNSEKSNISRKFSDNLQTYYNNHPTNVIVDTIEEI